MFIYSIYIKKLPCVVKPSELPQKTYTKNQDNPLMSCMNVYAYSTLDADIYWSKALSILFYLTFACVSEPPEPPPKTYTTKDKFEYFKPCVQVEMDNPDKQDTVTEIYIKGNREWAVIV